MMDELKKIVLFGVGAVASTYEKAADIIDELVEKGKITVEEGRELGEELKRTFKEKKEKDTNKEVVVNMDKSDNKIREVKIDQYNYVTRDEYEILKARVYSLERVLNKEEDK